MFASELIQALGRRVYIAGDTPVKVGIHGEVFGIDPSQDIHHGQEPDGGMIAVIPLNVKPADFPDPPARPKIVCLCGSTRFKDAWYKTTKTLTHAGYIVLGVGDLDPRPENRDVNVPLNPELKARLDALHLRKVELADEVMILNVGGYIGESTRNELAHARKLGKEVSFLEDPDTLPAEHRTEGGAS